MGLRVADLDRSLAFYTGLGYEVLGTVPETPFGSLTMLKLPDEEFVSIELVHDPDRGEVRHGSLNHFVVHVPDLRDFRDRMSASGIEVEEPSSPDPDAEDFWTAWVSDPDGYRIELVQWPAGHPDGMTRRDMGATD